MLIGPAYFHINKFSGCIVQQFRFHIGHRHVVKKVGQLSGGFKFPQLRLVEHFQGPDAVV